MINYLPFYFLITLFILNTACHRSSTTAEFNPKAIELSTNTMEIYYKLKTGESIHNFESKKIIFKTTESKFIHQHIMKGRSPMDTEGREKYIYLEPSEKYDFGQIVAYYWDDRIVWPSTEDKNLQVYGKVGKLTGASKGPTKVGRNYTEHYLDIDKVEVLK